VLSTFFRRNFNDVKVFMIRESNLPNLQGRIGEKSLDAMSYSKEQETEHKRQKRSSNIEMATHVTNNL